MPRKHTKREFERRASYHVYNRALLDRPNRSILLSESDRARFVSLIHEGLDREPTLEFYCFAFMRTHYHLGVFQTDEERALPRFMHSLVRGFTLHFNRSRGEVGPLWDGPYRARMLRTGSEVAHAIAYMHLNSSDPERTSHDVYRGERHSPRWLTPSRGMTVFGGRSGYEGFFGDTAKLRAARAQAEYRMWE